MTYKRARDLGVIDGVWPKTIQTLTYETGHKIGDFEPARPLDVGEIGVGMYNKPLFIFFINRTSFFPFFQMPC